MSTLEAGFSVTQMRPDRSADGERREAVAGLVDIAEVAGIEDGDEVPLQVVAPGVVGAAEAARVAASLVDDDGAAVAAHVHEGANLAVEVAHHEDGDTHDLNGPEVAGLAHLAGETEGEGQALEDAVDLELPAVGVVVEARGDLVDPVGQVDAIIREVVDLATGHGHQLFPTHACLQRRCAARSDSTHWGRATGVSSTHGHR